jgi:hypothetical protein
LGRIIGGMSIVAPLLLPGDEPASRTDPLRLAAAAYLDRFTGPSRTDTESDLSIYLAWWAEQPSGAGRAVVHGGAFQRHGRRGYQAQLHDLAGQGRVEQPVGGGADPVAGQRE